MIAIQLNGDDLPWVTKAKHIGNMLHESGTTDADVRVKKGIFIQTAMELNQEFATFPAKIRYRLNLLYNSHFSGSNIWKLNGQETQHLISAWNKNIKLIYDLPWETHRWVIQLITGDNLKCILYAQFVKFINAIHKSSKPAIKYLYFVSASDVRSITGSNLRSILVDTGIQAIPGTLQLKEIKKTVLHRVPSGEERKIPLLESLLDVQSGASEILFDEEESDTGVNIPRDILHSICIT